LLPPLELPLLLLLLELLLLLRLLLLLVSPLALSGSAATARARHHVSGSSLPPLPLTEEATRLLPRCRTAIIMSPTRV